MKNLYALMALAALPVPVAHAAPAQPAASHAIATDSDTGDNAEQDGEKNGSDNLFPPVTKLGQPGYNEGITPQDRMGRDRDSGNDNRPLLP